MNKFTLVLQADETSALELQLGRFIPTASAAAAASAAEAAQSAAQAAAVLSSSLLKANNLSDLVDAPTARSNLSAAKNGANSDITSLSGLTTALSIAQGGTGQSSQSAALSALLGASLIPIANGGTNASTAAAARTNLGAAALTANTFTAAQSIQTSGLSNSFQVVDTGVNGANIKLIGNGATTPSKFIRVNGGALQIVNDAYGATIFNLTDAGVATFTARPVFNSATPWDSANLSSSAPLAIANGGTGSSTAAAARTALSAAVNGANGDITSLTGLTTALSIAQGGTGSNNAAAAVQALGAAPKPNASGGTVGNFQLINGASGSAYTLPAGGTWAYFIQYFNGSGAFGGSSFVGAGIAAGGTQVGSAASGFIIVGFCWRIA